ncbi:hypothetical protein [Streptomyces mirabilis]|uniref:hypothetical protein n=1 Tax=Streptomyces mirabilis TaxID=68239 RepID=UPI0033A0A45C
MGESARYAAVYTGLSVDEEDRAMDVYRMPSASFDADLCGAAEKGVTVRLHDTDANRTDLEALADRMPSPAEPGGANARPGGSLGVMNGPERVVASRAGAYDR